MMKWAYFREKMIAFGYGILDYDRNIPQKRREATRLEREKKKSARLMLDQTRFLKVQMNALAKKEQADTDRRVKNEQREIENRRYQPSAANQRVPFCPFCGCEMIRTARSTDSGGGCLIFIIGLLFSPVIIGIPLLFIGWDYMSKKQVVVICPLCGVENGRA